ncbi:hypothetical protein BEWA_021590 [Theileria equi strain WA]|uniref:TLC domain-containing protein n=1 Tax=Theileria equi strain WA TaxID=1537102 RepID=L0AWA6_THEEQ|nr:hypothetical protein BEWA_021590 [Theileria equi strain WA]AFZ79311.1 hypothetical protein BEWA_021590 [Theileria equi strain WA]|eukprot:XP_004828977.1 hypothetical protein BEWA_021590 [Theileria equi strain WA]
MSVLKDKFLSIHRSESKTTFWGKVSVLYSIIIFATFDHCILVIFWFLNSLSNILLDHRGYFGDLIFHAVISLFALASLIPGTIIFYCAIFCHFVKFWHLCHVAGKVVGNIVFAALKLAESMQFPLVARNGEIIARNFGILIFLFFLKILFHFVTLWYILVLERIRSVGGTGNELKSADEIENEKSLTPQSTRVIMLDGCSIV